MDWGKKMEAQRSRRGTAAWAQSMRTCPCGEDYQQTTERELPGALSSPWLSTQLRDTRAAYATTAGRPDDHRGGPRVPRAGVVAAAEGGWKQSGGDGGGEGERGLFKRDSSPSG